MTRALAGPEVRRQRLSSTLSAYIARQYTHWLLAFLFGLTGVILLVSTVDLLDRSATKDTSLGVVAQMILLKLPHLTQEVMPFTVLLAGLTCFWRLTRSHELVVTRSVGISIWQLLAPVIGVAALAGLLTIALLNPLAAVLLERFEQLEAQAFRNQPSTLAVSATGLWLRQADDDVEPGEGQSVIHAMRISTDPLVLHDVSVFRFRKPDRFIERIDAHRAELGTGEWVLFDAARSQPGQMPEESEVLRLGTSLTHAKILDSFAPPETISFWSLPGFIRLLDNAGFSAVRHKLQLHKLLATPLLFAAMVLLAATFSLRPQRRGRVGLIILSGVLTGFLVYFLSNFVFALGLSGKIPVVLAAWTPAGVSLMLGLASLLHLEDG